MSTVTVHLTCPNCGADGHVDVPLHNVPGYGVGIDSPTPAPEMSCVCLQSPWVRQDVLREHLVAKAEESALYDGGGR
jgi:hypothetical protein